MSNLGILFVNNDALNLHIGLRNVMLQPGQSIFLFIGSQRQIGVSALRGLGDGRLDALGEGADGLDFLENLSFGNFTPSVGCILGDEFGDAQTRSFARAALPGSTGQGVFYLDESFTSVPGIRIQQFNQSPQTAPVLGEENADLIKVSIPLAALGGLRSGDRIQLGAVAGLAAFDSVAGVRPLDSGFIGQDLRDAGAQQFLEGVSIRLAEDADRDNDGLRDEAESQLGTDPARADTDGDGLSDGWEARHRLDPLSATAEHGALGDPDNDHFSNDSEQRAGTNPRDAKSSLRLTVSLKEAASFRLSWPSAPGMRYEILSAENSLGPFLRFGDPSVPIMATSTNTFFDGRLSLDAGQHYFRVRLAE
jgi:hypothetical protein